MQRDGTVHRRFEIVVAGRPGESPTAGEGLPELVRADDGSVLRLSYAPGGRKLGSHAGRPVYGSIVEAMGDEPTASPARRGGWWVPDVDATDPSIAAVGALDEVGVPLGPERGGGMFDATATDAAFALDRTATAARGLRPEFSRMAVLARVAAWHDPHATPPSARLPRGGEPLAALMRGILGEPLDPLPVIEDARPGDGGRPDAAPVVPSEPPPTPAWSRRWGVMLLVGVCLVAGVVLVRC